MSLDLEFIEGVSDNLSPAGLLFFTEDPIRVRIHMDSGGESRVFPGRLIRVQQMNEESTGLAVEFDESQGRARPV